MTDTNLPELPQPDLDGYEEDTQAQNEQKDWKKLDELSEAKHNNALAIHRTIKFLIPAGLVVAFVGFTALSTIYVLHLLLPADCRWLTPDEVQHIHSMIFSGVVGGAVALLAKTYLSDAKKD